MHLVQPSERTFEGRCGFPRHRREFSRAVRLLPVRLLRHADRQRFLSRTKRVRVADDDLRRVRRRLPDAAAGRHRAGRVHRRRRPPQGPDRHAVHHGERHRPDRVRAGLRDDRPAGAALVLLGRLLQGFSAGAELGGVSVYLAELATPGRKGFFTSWQSASQQVAIVVAAGLGFALNQWLSASAAAWGWRAPFFVGCMIVPFIFMLRRNLEKPRSSRRASIARA